MKKIFGSAFALLLAACASSYTQEEQHALYAYQANLTMYGEEITEPPLSDQKLLSTIDLVCPLLEARPSSAQVALDEFTQQTSLQPAHAKLVFGAGVGAHCREYLEVLPRLE